MADSVSITANVIEGSSLSTNVSDGSNVITNVTEGVSIAAQVTVGGKGDKGDIGEQGPQGVQGPQGERGGDVGSTYHPRLPRSQVEFIDDASVAWDDYYDTGDGSLDTNDYVLGSSSIKITTQTPTSFAGVSRELSPVVDLEQSCIRLFVKSDGWGNLDNCTLILSSDGYTLSNTATLDIGTRLINPPDGEWIEIVVPRSAFVVDGTMDWSNLDLMLFRIRDTGTLTSVWFDGIMSFEKATRPIVSITFDDGFDDTYLHGKRIMDKYGYAGTAYIVPSLLGDTGFLTNEQVDGLASAGWDISGHNFTNLTALTPEELEEELIATKDYLTARGHRGSEHYAYPNGAYNEAVNSIVRKYFASGANIDGWNNSQSYISPYRVNRQSIDRFTSVAMVKGWIDDAIANNEWVILNFHGLVNSLAADEDWLIDDFEEIVDYLNSLDAEVRTMSEALGSTITGGVEGPLGATNNAVAVFDGTSGQRLKSGSAILVNDIEVFIEGVKIVDTTISSGTNINGLILNSAFGSAGTQIQSSGTTTLSTLDGSELYAHVALGMTSHKITNLANGTVSTDAVNKGQVDTLDAANVKLTGAQTVAGVKTFTSAPKIDTINENTSANGVTIDGLNLKGGKLNTNNSVVTANVTDAAITPAKRSGGFAIGVISSSTLGTTGNKAVTGVGFTPKYVMFEVLPSNSTTVVLEARGAMTTTNQYTISVSGSGSGHSRYGSTSNCISWVSAGSTTPSLLAAYVSMDADGFTINVSTAANNFDVVYVAYG